MATPRDIRRLALLALYQLDARLGGSARAGDGVPAEEHAAVRASLDEAAGLKDEGLTFPDSGGAFRESERDKAMATAVAAWTARAEADAAISAAAPDWPAHRLAAIDRCLIRLAYHEMAPAPAGPGLPPGVVIGESVELARVFSTEKSPAFVNALLDRMRRARATA